MTLPEPRSPVKMPGGKARLVEVIRPYLPKNPTAYHEPFVGGGAMFFRHFRHVRPAFLSDTNERLIIAYKAVRDDVDWVMRRLRLLRYERGCYQSVREEFNDKWASMPPAHVAAYFIYLSKCGMNGLYRENAAGEYNVPFGKHKNPKLCDEDNLRACSAALQGVSIECEDFEIAACRIEDRGDPRRVATYWDPVYIPEIDGKSFTRYGARGFGLADHVRLAGTMRRLDGRGISVVTSNSDTWPTRDIYRGFKMRTIVAARSIGAGADRRAPALELIIHNRRKAA